VFVADRLDKVSHRHQRCDGPQNQLIKATLRRLQDHPQKPSTLKAEISSVVRMFETLDAIIIGRHH
jgi:5-methylcytosine-specific restriction endonuclease McrBC regulatory subunit McrC